MPLAVEGCDGGLCYGRVALTQLSIPASRAARRSGAPSRRRTCGRWSACWPSAASCAWPCGWVLCCCWGKPVQGWGWTAIRRAWAGAQAVFLTAEEALAVETGTSILGQHARQPLPARLAAGSNPLQEAEEAEEARQAEEEARQAAIVEAERQRLLRQAAAQLPRECLPKGVFKARERVAGSGWGMQGDRCPGHPPLSSLSKTAAHPPPSLCPSAEPGGAAPSGRARQPWKRPERRRTGRGPQWLAAGWLAGQWCGAGAWRERQQQRVRCPRLGTVMAVHYSSACDAWCVCRWSVPARAV